MAETSVCPICGGTGSTVKFQLAPYTIRQCLDCTHGFVSPMPSSEVLSQLYNQQDEDSLLGNGFSNRIADYLDARPHLYLRHFHERLDLLNRVSPRPDAVIFDYGCSNGVFVQALRQAGFARAWGFDVTERDIEEGRKRWGLDLVTGDLGACLAGRWGTVDVLYSTNVLEHVPDPGAVLAELASTLKPGGHAILTVPNAACLQVYLAGAKSPIIDPPHHLQYFSPRSFQRLLRESGFEPQVVKTPFWSLETDLYLTFMGWPLGVARAARWCALPFKFGVQTMKWGGTITVLARKQS